MNNENRRWIEWLARSLSRTIGLKILMALSGLGLVAWVSAHAVGNLFVFAGPDLINTYGAALQGSPLLWIQRVGVLVMAGTHIGCAVVVTRRARRSRQDRYRHGLRLHSSTPASRTMRYGGAALALYVGYHLAHIYGPMHPDFVATDVHHNLVAGLSDPLAAGLYIAAAVALGLHLHHGAWSAIRTLGYDGRFAANLRGLTRAYATLLTVAFLAPCVAAVLGWL